MTIPQTIGRYEIIKELGHGGMAVVYLARDPLMDRQVAVKLMPRQLTYNESLRGRFQREARIVASLEHPAIVPVHDFGEYNEQPYLVMRYMVGGSLNQHMKHEKQAMSEVVRILSPLSQALDKAHAQHVIHRDLKPDNILFDADDNSYLSDFGIARLTEGTQTTSIMGTPAYMSPEQIKGDVELDGRSDIYALGVILFEMLSGEQPYTAETPTQVMMKHVLDPIPIILDRVSELPPMAQVVIERAMAKERDDRFPTAEDLLDAVKELLTGSQAAEVGAAMAGTLQQETMLEIPDPEPDPLETVVDRPLPTPASGEIEREAQAAAFYARLQSAVSKEDWIGALTIGAQLQEIDRDYRDTQAIMAGAQSHLTQTLPVSEPPLETIEPNEASGVEPELAKEESPKRGRQIVALGCVLIILIFICLAVAGAVGNFIVDDDASSGQENAVGSQTSDEAGAVVSFGSEVDSVSPTATIEAAATETVPLTPRPPDPTPEEVEYEESGNIFFDTFDGESSYDNWEMWGDESAEFYLDDGKLIAAGYDQETMNWVKQIDTFTDLEVLVSADVLEGGSSAFFGIVFDGDGDNYVGCFIQGDNTAYCNETLYGETEYSDWVVVDLSILRANEMLFVVSEEEWALVLNGDCVGSGFVDFGPEGQPALAVGTATDEDLVQIAYDDFQVNLPTMQSLSYLQCEPEYYE